MKKFLLLISLIMQSYCLSAQGTYLPPVRSNSAADKGNRFFTGGNLGLQFGSTTAIDVSPLLGYRVTNDFSVGVGATYMYFHYKNSFYDYTNDVYGGSVFARYNILENIFLHSEFESLSVKAYYSYTEYIRKQVNALYMGGGLRQMIGDYSSLNLMILYDVMHDNQYSPYSEPLVIRIGFDIGL